jgi:aspartyl-tRNA(Asn)/glutamyl-tRNA(Gln) amidotransferase subunit C
MSTFEPTEIKRVAHLSRLSITEEEIPALSEAMTNIMALIDQMQAIDTTGVVPLTHIQAESMALRADAVTEKNLRDIYQTQAPSTQDGLYLVPRVIE